MSEPGPKYLPPAEAESEEGGTLACEPNLGSKRATDLGTGMTKDKIAVEGH